MLKHVTKPSDFVVLKLDIDNSAVEEVDIYLSIYVCIYMLISTSSTALLPMSSSSTTKSCGSVTCLSMRSGLCLPSTATIHTGGR